MSINEEIESFARSIPAELKFKKNYAELGFTVAERKAFLSKKKLDYRARFRVDDAARQVTFTEMLRESGSGLSSGDASPGFGFKKEVYSSGTKGRSGTIEEQSNLFGKKYEYKFDYKKVRARFEELAAAAGYAFDYRITAFGL